MNPPRVETRKSKLETRTTTSLRLASGSLTGARGRDELLKQALREWIIRHAFRMPLDSHNPVGIAGPFHAFDDAIRGVGGDTKLFPGLVDGLVMAAIDMRG